VDEIGVFRMTVQGLEPVANPSELFMGDRASHASGSAVTALLEGTRPLLVEIQALAAKAGFGTPQRVATGFDGRRLALLLAVLDKRAGLAFGQLDVFVNVVGGMRLQEPAGDLAVAAALASSVYDAPLPSDAVFAGEVGLGGEVRAVSQVERRIAEGFQEGRYRAPARPGISYMLSPARYKIDEQGRISRSAPLPHVMLYGPYLNDADIGGARGSFAFINRVGPHGMIIVPVGQKERETILKESQSLVEQLERQIGFPQSSARNQ